MTAYKNKVEHPLNKKWPKSKTRQGKIHKVQQPIKLLHSRTENNFKIAIFNVTSMLRDLKENTNISRKQM